MNADNFLQKMNAKKILRSVVAALIAAGGLAGFAIYWQYQTEMRAIRQRLEAGSQVVNTACGPVEYAAWGEGEPVLIFHATGGSYDQALLMARMYLGAGYRSIAPSRFGHLRTPQAADHSAEAQADMFACLLDALKIEKASLLGMSAGSPIAIQFALRHPERTQSLVLLSSAAYIPPEAHVERKMPVPDFVYNTLFGSDFLFWAVVRYAGSTLEASFGATPELQASLAPEEKASLDEMIEGMLPIRMHTAGLVNDGEIADKSFVTVYPLEQIQVPALVVAAKDDTVAVPAGSVYTAGHIPGARLVMYDTGGHALLGHQAEIRSMVQAFLDQVSLAGK